MLRFKVIFTRKKTLLRENKKIFIKKKLRKLQISNFNKNSIKKKESGETKK